MIATLMSATPEPPQTLYVGANGRIAPFAKIPRHVGIIMDGNGRWAKARGLPRTVGHRAGLDNLRRVLVAAMDAGIQVLSVYAFSTENWRRPVAEVEGMMRLVSMGIRRDLEELHRSGVRIVHSGRLQGLASAVWRQIERAVEATKENDRIVLNVAINYGGRAEIIDAVRNVMRTGLRPEEVQEEDFSRHFYVPNLPDLDLIIRTGGENRLSNFMLWHAATAIYYSTPTYWPDFDEHELQLAIEAYQQDLSQYDMNADDEPADLLGWETGSLMES